MTTPTTPLNHATPEPHDRENIDGDSVPFDWQTTEPEQTAEPPEAIPISERRISRSTYLWRSLLATLVGVIPVVVALNGLAGLTVHPRGFKYLGYLSVFIIGVGLNILVLVQYIRHVLMPRLLDIGCTGLLRALMVAAVIACGYMLKLWPLLIVALAALPSGLIKANGIQPEDQSKPN